MVAVMRSAAKALPAWARPRISTAAINDFLIPFPFMATSFGWGRTADTRHSSPRAGLEKAAKFEPQSMNGQPR